jgi:hypothetical protein
VSGWPLLLVPLAGAIAASGPGGGVAVARRGLWWLGLALCTAAVLASARARAVAEPALLQTGWPYVDLEHDAMPASPPPYVEVRGVLRDGFVLGEYAVPEGDVPDQSRPADAVLVPLAPSTDATIALRGAIVVARVRADTPRTQAMVTLRGRTERLPAELTGTLVDLSGGTAAEVSAVLVDTLRVPSAREAWTAIALALGLVVGTAAAFHYARRDGVFPMPPV